MANPAAAPSRRPGLKEDVMKSLRGKIVLAVIILSCGFVMQAEQASEAKRPNNIDSTFQRSDLAYNPPDSALGTRPISLPSERNSW